MTDERTDQDPGGEPDESNPVAAESPEVEVAPPGEDEALRAAEAELARVTAERQELHERLLRMAAEYDNYRKRMLREREDTIRRANEELVRELLPVLDNLERAVDHASDLPEAEGILAGVRLVHKQFVDALSRFGVHPFSALGEPFDPARMDAIQQVESADHPTGTVVGEMVKGYHLGDRLLRPASVIVSRRPEPAAEPPEGDGATGPEVGDGGSGEGR